MEEHLTTKNTKVITKVSKVKDKKTGAKQTTLSQITNSIDYCLYTNTRDAFYASPFNEKNKEFHSGFFEHFHLNQCLSN
jgi:hypothetical protein